MRSSTIRRQLRERRSVRRTAVMAIASLVGAVVLTVLPATGSSAAEHTINNSHPSTTYSAGWTYTTSAVNYAYGDAHYSNTPGRTATFAFTGTSVTVIGGKNPDHGRADVKVCDGAGANCGASTMIDTYAAAVQTRQTLYTASGLSAGAHRLVLTTRGDTSGTGFYTDIDYFIADDDLGTITGTRYIDNREGSGCSNSGTGSSISAPWCDFAPVQDRALAAGAQLLLARGGVWTGSVRLTGGGTSASWITLGAYGTGSRPVIQGTSQPSDRTVVLQDPDYWRVQDLELRNAGMGLLIEYTSHGHHGLDIRGLYAHDLTGILDVQPKQIDYPDIQNSTAITISAAGAPVTTAGQSVVSGITIRNNLVHNAAGVYLVADPLINGLPAFAPSTFANVDITNNNFSRSAAPIIAIEAATAPVFEGNWVDCTGHAYEPQGTTCFFVSKVDGAMIQNNTVMNMPDTASHDQTGIDLEYKVRDTKIRGNLFANNAGAGVELLQLGRAGDYSTNTLIEANTFYNNGWGGSPGMSGHIAPFGGGAAAAQVMIRANDYQMSPTGFVNAVGNNPALANVTQVDNSSASSMYPSALHFSGTQGQNQWRNQSYSGSGNWTDMPTYTASPSRWTAGGGSSIDAFTLVPGVGSSQWVARTWIAPSSGTIRIHGQATKYDDSGTAASILIEKQGSFIWPISGGPYETIAAGDRAGVTTNITTTVEAGDVIRFVVHANGVTGGAVSWTPSISY